MPSHPDRQGIDIVDWHPRAGYGLPLEVMRVSELRRRGSPEHFARAQRVEFFLLFGVTRGPARHTVDFQTLALRAGDWVFLRPGQMQRFAFSPPWDGWVIAFQPHFLPPAQRRLAQPMYRLATQLEEMPGATRLTPQDHLHCCALAERMRNDADTSPANEALTDLLLHELCALLARLRLHCLAPEAGTAVASGDVLRVIELRRLVDAHFRGHHSEAWYARKLACSSKTLARALRTISGTSLKALLDERLALEARRLLTYGNDPVKTIAADLGFSEASNFSKFFKRCTGQTPAHFRRKA